MSQFEDVFDRAVPAFLAAFGEDEPAHYLPGEVPVSVIVDRDVEARDEYGRAIVGVTEISWPRAEQPNHNKGDRIRLAGGETWMLNQLMEERPFIRYRVIPA
jgi:hypothetical protein